MKNLRWPIWLCTLMPLTVQAQRQVSDTIQISYMYEVAVIFEEPLIKEPRLGSIKVAQYTQFDQRTVLLKSNGDEMTDKAVSRLPNTNLIIKTTKGIYNFILTFRKEPQHLFITPDQYQPVHVYKGESAKSERASANELAVAGTRSAHSNPDLDPGFDSQQHGNISKSAKDVRVLLSGLNKRGQNLDGLAVQKNNFKMRMGITNIWVDNEHLYFKILIENYSAIPYDINYFRYVTTFGQWSLKRKPDPIDDKILVAELKEAKRPINPGKTFSNVIAISKFTLDKGQIFNIQVGEDNGARLISIPISRKDLLKAEPLNNL